jgi:hypothetical protein
MSAIREHQDHAIFTDSANRPSYFEPPAHAWLTTAAQNRVTDELALNIIWPPITNRHLANDEGDLTPHRPERGSERVVGSQCHGGIEVPAMAPRKLLKSLFHDGLEVHAIAGSARPLVARPAFPS